MVLFCDDRPLHPTQLVPFSVTASHREPFWRAAIATVVVLACGVLPATIAQAQSITPAADGTNTIVTPNGSRLDISGGTRSQDGANLFQSFQQFGLTADQIATFLATPQTRNILGRVVGGDASVINGLIQVSGSNANLYLMNPAGIVFGANASLNVSGTFTATTATGIGFGDRWFSAIGTNDYATLLGNPSAFAFTVTQPGAIVNAGSLAVTTGQNLSFVGGVVVNTGTLTAPGGQLTIAAIPGQSLVQLRQPGSLLSFELNPLNAQPATATTLQTLPNALPNAWTLPIASLPALLTGGNLQNATGITVNPNGTIRLMAAPQQSIVVEPGTAIASGSLTATGGTVQVLGDRVGAIGATISTASATSGGTVLLGGRARGQGTVPNASSTLVDGSSTINASSLVDGSGGQVVVWSEQATQFAGTIRARGGTQAGNGGLVEISSKGNLAYRGLVDATAPAGALGTVLFDPENITIVPGNGTDDTQLPTIFSSEFAGASLTISQNALQNTRGAVILEATNNITIQPLVGGVLAFGSGVTSVTFVADADHSGVGSFSMSTGDTITSPGDLSIAGATLTLGTLRTAALSGNAGSVTLSATGNITATAIDTASFDQAGVGANGGDVTLRAGGSIAVDSITTQGGQNAGDVSLTAQGNITTGAITTSTGSTASQDGAGGTIAASSTSGTITTGNLLTTGSAISGNVNLQASSSDGNITFTSIDTSASEPGSVGGAVRLTAGRFIRGTGFTLAEPSATITTAAASSGAVTIEHGGGRLNVPFTVGNAARNGTAGAIDASTDTAPNAIAPTRSFSQSATQGDIVISSTTASTSAQTPPTQIRNDPHGNGPMSLGAPGAPGAPGANGMRGDHPGHPETALEEGAIGQFQAYLHLPRVAPGSAQNTANVLTQIGVVAGVKPALVYASFVPSQVATENLPVRQKRPPLEAATPQTKALAAAPKPTAPAPLGELNAATHTGSADRRAQLLNAPSATDTDQLELVIVTADGKPTRRLVPGATRGQVLQVVRQFLSEISDPRKNLTTSYLAPAQQLYRWLVAPIEPVLQAQGIGNLAYISDNGLRFLPMGALHDGQRFLIEKYSIGLMPSLSLTDTRYVSLKNARVLAMGVSTFNDQPPLPAVPTELSVITQELWSGNAFLNQAFTLDSLKAERQREPFQIIHLATHGEFESGALSNSYIQLWDTKLRLDQLRQLGWNQPPVELLVLSACRTALGSDEAELGFAGFAVQAGVKSALASLWYVSDEGTLGLMTEFYRQLRTAPIKAEALRQAQIAMLKGKVQVSEGQLRGSRGGGIQLPIALPARTETYSLSHPYYWAAFTLIGSPW